MVKDFFTDKGKADTKGSMLHLMKENVGGLRMKKDTMDDKGQGRNKKGPGRTKKGQGRTKKDTGERNRTGRKKDGGGTKITWWTIKDRGDRNKIGEEYKK